MNARRCPRRLPRQVGMRGWGGVAQTRNARLAARTSGRAAACQAARTVYVADAHRCGVLVVLAVGVPRPFQAAAACEREQFNNILSSWYEIRACLTSIRITRGDPGTNKRAGDGAGRARESTGRLRQREGAKA